MSGKQLGPSLIIFILVVCVLTGCSHENDETKPTPVISTQPQTALPMPPLRIDSDVGWVLTDGRRSKLSDFRNKVLVVDFYATWCEPCRQSIPHLDALRKRYAARGFEVVGLNVGGPDDRVKVAGFAQELGITYPLGFPDQPLIDLFLSDNQTLPQSFIFGRSGSLVKRFIGYNESAGEEMDKLIQTEMSK